MFHSFELKNGIVYKITNYGSRWVVPELARHQILRMNHDDIGHFSFAKTYELISRQYWFKNMRRFIKKYIQNCLNCIYFKIRQENYWVCYWGYNDRKTSFNSEQFKKFCTELEIKHYLNAVAMPHGNVQVERYNHTIRESLATMGANKHDKEWDTNLKNIQLGLNGTFNQAIGVSPSEALMGYRVFFTEYDSHSCKMCRRD